MSGHASRWSSANPGRTLSAQAPRAAHRVRNGTLGRMPDHSAAPAAAPPRWLVACLCAAWCRTCDDYRQVMAEAQRAHPGLQFAWVDIEDHADALDDVDGAAEDIDNFPTLLLSQGDTPHFFGTLMPQAGVLERLLTQAEAGELPPVADATARRMAGAVRRLWASNAQAIGL